MIKIKPSQKAKNTKSTFQPKGKLKLTNKKIKTLQHKALINMLGTTTFACEIYKLHCYKIT